MAFFTNKQDSELCNKLILEGADVYLQKYAAQVTAGLLDLTVPATAGLPVAGFGVDALKSTVAPHVYVIDDNGELAEGKVISNDATDIVFDKTLMVLVSDGATEPTFTDGLTYDFYILSGSSSGEFGDFFGYTNAINFEDAEEKAELKVGIPKKLVCEGLLERTVTLSGTNFNVPNSDVLKDIFNMTTRGLQTGFEEYHTGFNPGNRADFQITFAGKTQEGKEFVIQAFKSTITLNGALDLSAEGFKEIPWNAILKSDTLRPEAYDAYRVRLET